MLWPRERGNLLLARSAAVIEQRIFCIHGGLSPDMESPSDLLKFNRPVEVPDTGLLCDTLWSDPDKDITGWAENDRGPSPRSSIFSFDRSLGAVVSKCLMRAADAFAGVSFTFGADVVSKFLERNDLDLIVRAHQACATSPV